MNPHLTAKVSYFVLIQKKRSERAISEIHLANRNITRSFLIRVSTIFSLTATISFSFVSKQQNEAKTHN